MNSFNVEQQREANRKALDDIGGADALAALIGVNLATGLSYPQVESMRQKYGDNVFPESPMDTYLELLFAALSDTTLLILIAAATVSLLLGIFTDHEGENGWTTGTAIFIAIFLVSNISAGNDYSKQLQFKALENTSADDERCSVLREGAIERICPKDVVVGDILVLQVMPLHPSVHHREPYHMRYIVPSLRITCSNVYLHVSV